MYGYPPGGGYGGGYNNPYPQQYAAPGYGQPGAASPPDNTKNVIPDFTEERMLLQEERARINELYNRIYGYLLIWETETEGLRSRNPHLFIASVTPTLTALINALHSNTTARANLTKIIADVNYKLSKGEDDNDQINNVVSTFIKRFGEQRAKMGESIGVLGNTAAQVQLPQTTQFDVGSMIRASHEQYALRAAEKDRKVREKADDTAFLKENHQFGASGTSDPELFTLPSMTAPIQEYPDQREIDSRPETRWGVTSEGNFCAVDRYNRLVPTNNQAPAKRVVQWMEYSGKMYGVGDDGCSYELVKITQ